MTICLRPDDDLPPSRGRFPGAEAMQEKPDLKNMNTNETI